MWQPVKVKALWTVQAPRGFLHHWCRDMDRKQCDDAFTDTSSQTGLSGLMERIRTFRPQNVFTWWVQRRRGAYNMCLVAFYCSVAAFLLDMYWMKIFSIYSTLRINLCNSENITSSMNKRLCYCWPESEKTFPRWSWPQNLSSEAEFSFLFRKIWEIERYSSYNYLSWASNQSCIYNVQVHVDSGVVAYGNLWLQTVFNKLHIATGFNNINSFSFHWG